MTLPLLRLTCPLLPAPCRGCVASSWAGCVGCPKYVTSLESRC